MNMVIYFNKKDLSNFGRHLLSDERTKRITASYNSEDNLTLTERLKEVYQSDIDEFLKQQKK